MWPEPEVMNAAQGRDLDTPPEILGKAMAELNWRRGIIWEYIFPDTERHQERISVAASDPALTIDGRAGLKARGTLLSLLLSLNVTCGATAFDLLNAANEEMRELERIENEHD